jgi:hypothetical protein
MQIKEADLKLEQKTRRHIKVNEANHILMGPIKERERKIAQQNKARSEGKPVFVPLEQ